MIVNEWVFHDIRGDNGFAAQSRVEVFLESLRDGPEQIVVPRGTRWTDKAWQLWEIRDPRVQILSKLLYLGILIDPLKSIHVYPEQLHPLPNDLAMQVPADDIYLFQAALASATGLILTTDGRLIDTVTSSATYGIVLQLRDDYYHEHGF